MAWIFFGEITRAQSVLFLSVRNLEKCFENQFPFSMCGTYGSISPFFYLRFCSSVELGFCGVAPHVLGAILVYKRSSSGHKEPGIYPGHK